MNQQQHSPDSNFAKLLALKNRKFLYNRYEILIKEVHEMDGYFVVETSKNDIEIKNTKFEVNDFFEKLQHLGKEVATLAKPQKSEIVVAVESFFENQMKKINEGKFTPNDFLATKAVSVMTKTYIASRKSEFEIKILEAKSKDL